MGFLGSFLRFCARSRSERIRNILGGGGCGCFCGWLGA